MKVHPYLGFDGRCEEAFAFYEKHLGAKTLTLMPHEGTPMMEHVPPEWRAKIMHGQIQIGDQVVMASDAPPGRYERPKGISISLVLTEVDEAERAYAALAEGGEIQMPLQQTFWAARFGMLVDRFGIPWMINCDQPS